MGSLFSFDCQITMMKVLILLSCLAYSIHAANPDVDNGMFQTMYNYLKSQPILLQEEQRQAENRQQNLTYYVRADGEQVDCNCNTDGTEGGDETCDSETGQCHCKCDVTGDKCDTCTPYHHGFPDCHECQCNEEGSSSGICDIEAGQCPCKSDLITGLKCDESIPGHYDFPDPKPCECNAEGSTGIECDDNSGKCNCNANVVGDKCTQCAAEHFAFPTCEACMCNAEGSEDNTCDENGKCFCNTNVVGDKCDQCNAGFVEFPACDQCAAEHFGENCQECQCNPDGSESNNCDPVDGKCPCKEHIVGDKCDAPEPGFFDFPDPKPCTCDAEGAVDNNCDNSGKCTCNPMLLGITVTNVKVDSSDSHLVKIHVSVTMRVPPF